MKMVSTFTPILFFWQSVKIMHLFRQGRQEKHLNLICLATCEGQLSKCVEYIKVTAGQGIYNYLSHVFDSWLGRSILC